TPRGQWDRFAPYIRPERRARVAWESRLVAALIVVVVGVGPRVIPGLGHALLAWPFMHVLLGVFLMPEHTGLAHDGSQLRRTRTIYTSALVRFWMWNMPYHAEHHAHPAIPFHALPALHRELAPALCNVSRGYLGFHREALRRALRGR
ncbi:MAG: fatty acid desaturase, partial [Myxococcales bacterium]|nr:fatty acid desaturase [Myxococcales bacterium]